MVPSATDDQLEATLARFWGYRAFRPLQREAIEANLENRDSVVVLPTGGGKSLCFQMPALVRSVAGPGLVVSPLVSLMKDQVDGLLASGIPAAALNSSLSGKARVVLYACNAGGAASRGDVRESRGLPRDPLTTRERRNGGECSSPGSHRHDPPSAARRDRATARVEHDAANPGEGTFGDAMRDARFRLTSGSGRAAETGKGASESIFQPRWMKP